MKDTHPFKLMRHSLEPRLTMRQLADEALVEPLNVIRTEQGLFSTPPHGIVLTLALATGLSEANIETQYHDWVKRHRWEANSLLRITPRPVGVSGTHPMFIWLASAYGSSLQGWAKNLCVHHSTLELYVHGKQHFMPGQLASALHAAGFAFEEINAMDQLGSEWWVKNS